MHRWGLGPVFFYEWLTASRRWQLFAGRAVFVGVLLAALLLAGWRTRHVLDMRTRGQVPAQKQLALLGQGLFGGLVGVQLVLALLAAPAATAGTVCHDKARGGLIQLLATDLSSAEIILGKLAARLMPVLSLVAAGAPVLSLALLLGGIDPGALIGAIWITLGVALAACSLTLMLSVWGTKTHEVLLATYISLGAFLLVAPTWWYLHEGELIGPVPHVLNVTNPFWLAFAPYSNPGATGPAEPRIFFALSTAFSALLVLVAVACVRRVTVRQAGVAGRSPSHGSVRWLQRRGGPALDANPVLWWEWHRCRHSRWDRVTSGVYGVAAVGFSGLAVCVILLDIWHGLAAYVNALQVSIGLLFVSVSAVTGLAEDRARGGLDALLATPLPTAKIVFAKWCGAFRDVPRLVPLPAAVAAVLAWRNGRWEAVPLVACMILAYGAAVTSLGLALATWIGRPGRAVTLCVTAYLVVTVGWFVVATMVVPQGNWQIASASPFFGVGLLTEQLIRVFPRLELIEINLLLWCAAYLVIAGLLFLATLFTFERNLGRACQRQPRPPRQVSLGAVTAVSVPSS